MEDGKDRRKHPRIKCQIPCEIRIGKATSRGMVLDVSEGGLSVRAEVKAADQGTAIHVDLMPPNSKMIGVDTLAWRACRVRRRSTDEVFIQMGLVLTGEASAFVSFVESFRKRDRTARIAKTNAKAPLKHMPRRPPLPPPDAEDEPQAAKASAAKEAPAPKLDLFAVRVKQNASPRTCRIVVGAKNINEAKAHAVAEVGPGWIVLEAEPA